MFTIPGVFPPVLYNISSRTDTDMTFLKMKASSVCTYVLKKMYRHILSQLAIIVYVRRRAKA